jgi:hypothetical protein
MTAQIISKSEEKVSFNVKINSSTIQMLNDFVKEKNEKGYRVNKSALVNQLLKEFMEREKNSSGSLFEELGE